jgi:UDP-N-acetylmuramyl pentapeptide phosphotransferase/UDP-N-acetylglucosamine-1-phosphate transferase
MNLGGLGVVVVVFLLAWWFTGRLCSPASRFYFLDLPNERSLHTAPLPRTGGLAIFGSVLLGIVASFAVGAGSVLQTNSAILILSMTLLVGAISFWEDLVGWGGRVGLSVGLRLGVQALAAVGVVWGAGLTVKTISVPVLGSLSLGEFAVPVTVLFLMWVANLYNFMDGMDGFAGGMTVVGHGVLGFLAWRGGHHGLMVFAFLVMAAAGGFLSYNLPPARIFMGDVGSVPLGFISATLIVMGVRDGLFDMWAPLLVFSPFFMDATVTLFKRMLRGEQFWHAHREHYYQRLVLAGWGHKKTVLAEYGLMLACGSSALIYLEMSEQWRLILLLGWIAMYYFLAHSVGVIEKQFAELHQ